jgi:putative spermidine/putrescine transport system substrate-binding protein
VSELVKAARKEGALDLPAFDLNGVALGALEQGFERKYGIRVRTLSVGSADQFSAAGQGLDAFSVAPDVAEAHTSQEAPYVVFYWQEIPPELKNAKAYWYSDCGGYVAIGWDSSAVPAVNAVSDLASPAYRGKVTLEGDPLRWDTGLAGVLMASLATTAQPDGQAGVAFFQNLKAIGNFVPQGVVDGPPALMIGPDYDQLQLAKTYSFWKWSIPARTVSAYNAEVINRAAPHPAAARLWEEYLFSDTGQNLCMQYGARPARMAAMGGDGVLDMGAAGRLTPPPAGAVTLTAAQFADARAYVEARWVAAVGQ